MLKVPNFESTIKDEVLKKQVEDEKAFKEIKRRFVRFAAEELLRRKASTPLVELVTDKTRLEKTLCVHSDQFFDEVFAVRKAKIEKDQEEGKEVAKANSGYEHYEATVKEMKRRLGYLDEERKEEARITEGGDNIKSIVINEIGENGKEVLAELSFEESVALKVKESPWKNEGAYKLCEDTNQIFIKNQTYIHLCNVILDDGNSLADIRDLPFSAEESKDSRNEIVLAMVI